MKNFFTQLFSNAGVKAVALALFVFAATAQISVAQTTPCNPQFTFTVDTTTLTVHFTPAINPTNAQLTWNFGDGKTFTGNPVAVDHQYLNKGTYWVCLSVTVPGVNGTVACKMDHCDSVHVGNLNPPPPPACCSRFTFRAGNTNYSVIFTGCQNPTGTQYCWNYGDGSPVYCSNNQNTDHTYAGPGAYVVCCDVSVPNNVGAVGCTSHFCDTVKIGTPPPPPPPTCDPHFTFKTDTTNTVWVNGAINPTGTIYSWNWGDGTSGSGNPADHHYASPGTYWVCLTVQVPANSANTGCKNTMCDSIHVGNPPPPPPKCDAHFTFKVDSTKCTVFFYPVAPSSINNGTSYVWTFGDGTSGTGNPADHHYMKPGAYWVCLKVYVKGLNGAILCATDHCDSIHVYCTPPPPPPPPPVCSAHFVFKVDSATNTVCFVSDANPTGTVYIWNFGDSTTSKDKNPCHQYAKPGIYNVCLVVETPAPNATTGGCRNTYCVKVSVGATPPPPPPACSAKYRYYFDYNNPFTVKFTPAPNPPGTTYLWTFGDGSSSPNVDPSHVFPDTGLYQICLTVTTVSPNSSTPPCTDKWCRWIYINAPIVNPNGGSDQVMIHPNPSIGSALIEISDVAQPVMLQLYNNKGEMVVKREGMNNGSYSLDTHNLQPGLYFYRVVNGSDVISSGKLIVQ